MAFNRFAIIPRDLPHGYDQNTTIKGCLDQCIEVNFITVFFCGILRRVTLRLLIIGIILFFAHLALMQAAYADRLLSKTDSKLMRDALKAADKRHWKTLQYRESRLKSVLARKFLLWHRLAADGFTPGFHETDQFRIENPNWPRMHRLLRRAEQAIPRSWSDNKVIEWFGSREPLSALGAARLGEAERAIGEIEKGTERLRKAWITGDFNRSQSKAFYKRFKSILTRLDHQKRLDRLLWDGRHRSAGRLWSLVSKDWQKLAQARIALRQQSGNVDTLIKRVPRSLKSHPGLVYERLRWRRIKKLDSAINLAKQFTSELPYAEKLWKERAIIARRALRKGNVTDAYKIARRNGLAPGGVEYAEAEWLSGWIALRFIGDHGSAFQHFERMHSAVKFPISIARGAYWAGRAKEAGGHKGAAFDWYRKAAEYSLTYYGQLAYSRLNPGKSLRFPSVIQTTDEVQMNFNNHELVRIMRMLENLGESKLVKLFFNSLVNASNDPKWWANLAKLATKLGRPDLSIKVGKKAAQMGYPLPSETFPVLELPVLPNKAKSNRPEVALSLAVIRQESAFRVNAESRAGAKGLMQIMPTTAKLISQGLKIQYSHRQLTKNPSYNLTLGQSYLGDLIKKFRGSYVLALVSYNAGPHRALRWIRSFGDLREDDVNSVDWVEMIPFNETRDYVQRVLESLQVYRSKLSTADVVLGLEADLHF